MSLRIRFCTKKSKRMTLYGHVCSLSLYPSGFKIPSAACNVLVKWPQKSISNCLIFSPVKWVQKHQACGNVLPASNSTTQNTYIRPLSLCLLTPSTLNAFKGFTYLDMFFLVQWPPKCVPHSLMFSLVKWVQKYNVENYVFSASISSSSSCFLCSNEFKIQKESRDVFSAPMSPKT